MKNTKLTTWAINTDFYSRELTLEDLPNLKRKLITTGNLRSYGDAPLYKNHVSMLSKKKILDFNKKTGLLKCEAGLLFCDIIKYFLPIGWFLPVTPGTKFITVGGAIAADIHGKNHFNSGCFSDHLESFDIQIHSNKIITCSKIKNKKMFYATCGGMGLTGVILSASFKLKRVPSSKLKIKNIISNDLEQTLARLTDHKKTEYSVAWIDCLAKKSELGKGVVTVGKFHKDNKYDLKINRRISIPFKLPNFLINKYLIMLYNKFHWLKSKINKGEKIVDYDTFFYPLDHINNWNNLYGKNGFVQLQFVVPKQQSYLCILKILELIKKSKYLPCLAVVKLHGVENKNWLSFPINGYSVAIDFKMEDGLEAFIFNLTNIIISFNGRIYLAKDKLLTKSQLDQSYKKASHFRNFRKKNKLNYSFQSLLSERLEL